MTFRRNFALALAILATSSAFAAAPYKSSAVQQSELGIRIAGVLQAWSSPDFAIKVRPFYDPHGEIFFDLTPLAFHSLDEYIAYITKSAAGVDYVKLVERDTPVMHLTGPDNAWAAGIVTFTMKPKNAPEQSFAIRWTSIWQREQGVWKIVHEHYSVPIAEAGQ
jgi:hypothetical protein